MLSLCITRLSGKSKMYGRKNKTKKRTAPAMCGSMSAFECFFQ